MRIAAPGTYPEVVSAEEQPYHLVNALSPEEIRGFPGLTDPEAKAKLVAARRMGLGVRLALQPGRCWIATPGGQEWMGEGDNLNRAAAAALAELESGSLASSAERTRFRRVRRLADLGCEITANPVVNPSSLNSREGVGVHAVEVTITGPEEVVVRGRGETHAVAVDAALDQMDERLGLPAV